jgi:hypothetical protein
MSGTLQFTVRLTAETEAMFTSVERLLHYIDNLKQEAPSSIPDKKPADVWPAKGSLSMVGLKVTFITFTNLYKYIVPSLQAWKLICRLLKHFQNPPSPYTMLTCHSVINVLTNVVL